jgi:uncharacterized OB-fold protein
VSEWLAEGLIWPTDQAGARPGQSVRLQGERCHDCARASFPSTGSCTWCGGPTDAFALASTGTLVAATTVLHSTPGCELETPYVVCLLRFAEAGLDVLGRVLQVDDLTQLVLGAQLDVVADAPFRDGRQHFAFRRAANTI